MSNSVRPIPIICLLILFFLTSSCYPPAQYSGHGLFGLNSPDKFLGFDAFQISQFGDRNYESSIMIETKYDLTWTPYIDFEGSEYTKDRLSGITSFIRNDDDYKKQHNYAPYYFDVGVLNPIRVYSNTPVFGIPAGEDISEHVIVVDLSVRNMYCASFPDFNFIRRNKKGMNIRDYYEPGSAILSDWVIFSFDRIPDDMPKELTLTIEIDVVLNDSWFNFPWYHLIDKSNYKPITDKIMHCVNTVKLQR